MSSEEEAERLISEQKAKGNDMDSKHTSVTNSMQCKAEQCNAVIVMRKYGGKEEWGRTYLYSHDFEGLVPSRKSATYHPCDKKDY